MLFSFLYFNRFSYNRQELWNLRKKTQRKEKYQVPLKLVRAKVVLWMLKMILKIKLRIKMIKRRESHHQQGKNYSWNSQFGKLSSYRQSKKQRVCYFTCYALFKKSVFIFLLIILECSLLELNLSFLLYTLLLELEM